jgi:(p)ppGpp synthase/HD superfamily hydrolase
MVPYIYHPMDVGRILMDIGCPEEVVAAGILHDTVEDTEVTLDLLEMEFGENVAGIVAEVTEPTEAASWKERKEHTIERLKTASKEALHLLCADKFDNLRSIRLDIKRVGKRAWASFSHSEEDQRWYYESIVAVLDERITEEPLLTLLNRLKREVHRVFDLETPRSR